MSQYEKYLSRYQYPFEMESKAIDLRTMSQNFKNKIIPLEDIHQAINEVLNQEPIIDVIDPYKNKFMDHEDDEVATHFAYVKWEDLYLWPLFQRDVAPSHVRKILGDFEPTAVITACAIKMTIDGQVYYILWDGHHTVQTCRLKGYSVFPISYVDIDQVSQETIDKAGFDNKTDYAVWLAGKNMIRINSKNKRKLHPYDEFMIKLETKDQDTVIMKSILDKNKCVPKRHGVKPGAFTQFKSGEECFKLGHVDKDYESVKGSFLNRALEFHRTNWPMSPIVLEMFRPMAYLFYKAWKQDIIIKPSFDKAMGDLLDDQYGDPDTCQEKLKESYYNATANNDGTGTICTTDTERVLNGLISLWVSKGTRDIDQMLPTRSYRWTI